MNGMPTLCPPPCQPCVMNGLLAMCRWGADCGACPSSREPCRPVLSSECECCGYGEWAAWSKCVGGKQVRQRTCNATCMGGRLPEEEEDEVGDLLNGTQNGSGLNGSALNCTPEDVTQSESRRCTSMPCPAHGALPVGVPSTEGLRRGSPSGMQQLAPS